MRRRSTRFAAAMLAALALSSALFGGASARSELTDVRIATARFHSQVAAGKAGYGGFPAGVPLHECISNLNGPGAMGVHWVDGGLLDGVLDPTKPEVLVYAPDADGELHLAALEYVIFQADWYADPSHAGTMPMLFGHELMVGDAARFQIPPFFALHVWLYQDNPSGMFASFNPNVSCGASSASAGLASAGRGVTASLAAARDTRWICSVGASA
jgi:hypothetical protein